MNKTVISAPTHYMSGTKNMDVWGVLREKMSPEEYVGFLKGNVVKYTFRAGLKDAIDADLNKLLNYVKEWQRFHLSSLPKHIKDKPETKDFLVKVGEMADRMSPEDKKELLADIGFRA